MANRENKEDLDKSNRMGSNTNASTDPDELRILEAVLFASDELMNTAHLKTILPSQPDARRIRSMVEKINVQLQKERHPFEIVEIGGGYQFRTITYYHPWVRQIFKEKAAKKLSIQGLECLAIIAYKQPITKAEIEAIRGVVSDGAMKTLLEKRLVTITGRSDKPGRPLLYGTTQTFLKYFGLNRKEDLPRIEEFEAMAREKMEELSIDDLEQEEIDMKVDAVENTATEQPPETNPETVTGESSVFEVTLTDDDNNKDVAAEEPADRTDAQAASVPDDTSKSDDDVRENAAGDPEEDSEVDAQGTAEEKSQADTTEETPMQEDPEAAAPAETNGKTDEEQSPDGDAVDLESMLTEDTSGTSDEPSDDDAPDPNDDEGVADSSEVADDAPAPPPTEGDRPEETSTFEIHLPEPDSEEPEADGTISVDEKKTDSKQQQKKARKRKKTDNTAPSPSSPETDG